jgi:hypothetical protein
MKPQNWSICALSACMGGMLAACGPQAPVGGASRGAIPPASDLARPLSTLSGETFSTKKIGSDCVISEVGSAVMLALTYYVAGKSSGPYPGTFVEKGLVQELLAPSYAYFFRERFKVTSHRRTISGLVRSQRFFSVQGCHGFSDNGFHIAGARYRAMRSSGQTAITLTPQSFSESFH